MQTGHTLIAGTEWTWQAQSKRKSAFLMAGARLCGGKPVPARQRGSMKSGRKKLPAWEWPQEPQRCASETQHQSKLARKNYQSDMSSQICIHF